MFKKPTSKLDVIEQHFLNNIPLLLFLFSVATLFVGTLTDSLVTSVGTLISYLILALKRQQAGADVDVYRLSYTAICMWEAAEELRERKDEPWAAALQIHWGHVGTSAMRDEIIALAPACEKAWEARPHEKKDYGSYDWDHCHLFVMEYYRDTYYYLLKTDNNVLSPA